VGTRRPLGRSGRVVKELTEARHQLTVGNLLRNRFLPDQPERDALSRQFVEADERLTALQRDMARPFPYHFEIREQPVK